MLTLSALTVILAVSQAVQEAIDVSSFDEWSKKSTSTQLSTTFDITADAGCGGQNCITIRGIGNGREDIYVETVYDLEELVDVKMYYNVATNLLDNINEYGFVKYSCDGGSFVTVTFNHDISASTDYNGGVAIPETCDSLKIQIGGHLSGDGDYVYVKAVSIAHFTREYFAFSTLTSAENALAECVSRGLTLATITTQQENDAVNALCKQTADSVSGTDNLCWIGLHDKNSENTFEWEDGAPFVYDNWNSIGNGQYNRGGYDCVVMGADQKSWIDEASWQVNHCTGVNRVFLCSTTPVCLLNSNVIPTINHFPNNTIYLLLHIVLAMTIISIIYGYCIRKKNNKFIYTKNIPQDDESVYDSEKNAFIQ